MDCLKIMWCNLYFFFDESSEVWIINYYPNEKDYAGSTCSIAISQQTAEILKIWLRNRHSSAYLTEVFAYCYELPGDILMDSRIERAEYWNDTFK